MVCFGLKPRVAEWKVQMNPLSYRGILIGRTVSYKSYLLCVAATIFALV